MAVHPLLLICCGCRCCLARNFWNSCSFFSFAAVEIFHRSSGVGRLLPLRSDMEFVKYFTPVRLLKFSILPPKKSLNCDILGKILRILEVLLKFSLFSFYSNTKSLPLFCERFSLNTAHMCPEDPSNKKNTSNLRPLLNRNTPLISDIWPQKPLLTTGKWFSHEEKWEKRALTFEHGIAPF